LPLCKIENAVKTKLNCKYAEWPLPTAVTFFKELEQIKVKKYSDYWYWLKEKMSVPGEKRNTAKCNYLAVMFTGLKFYR
jgi:hypothetical protein